MGNEGSDVTGQRLKQSRETGRKNRYSTPSFGWVAGSNATPPRPAQGSVIRRGAASEWDARRSQLTPTCDNPNLVYNSVVILNCLRRCHAHCSSVRVKWKSIHLYFNVKLRLSYQYKEKHPKPRTSKVRGEDKQGAKVLKESIQLLE